MRPVIAYAFLAASLSLCLSPALAAEPTTLILQFEQPHSDKLLGQVKAEIGNVMQAAGLTFELKLFSELGPYAEFSNLMVVRMKGRCRMDASPGNEKAAAGPLAFTHTSNGKVLPFIEVACDRVRNVIRPAMWGDQFRIAEELMGRAVARVMAHEIYHVMTGTKHGDGGIARHSLSGAQLISGQLLFEAEDIERMMNSSVVPAARAGTDDE